MSATTIKPEDYERFRRFLETSCGIVLGDNKQYLVLSRLGGLMARQETADLGALVSRLEHGGTHKLRGEVVDAMTTNETQWFRDVYPFALLKDTLLPKFEQACRSSLRIWSAGCSSGQEPYSLSMAVEERREAGRGLEAQIVGTDISPRMITRAQGAEYGASEVRRGLSPERQRRFFVAAGGDRWKVRPETARRVTFRQHNLLESFTVLGSFDLIFCRNVLIYFSLASREQIIRRMAQTLNPGGYLVVGASESLSRNLDDFEMERCNPGVVYRRRQSPPRSRTADSLLSPQGR